MMKEKTMQHPMTVISKICFHTSVWCKSKIILSNVCKLEERLVFSFVCYFINGFGFEFILHVNLTLCDVLFYRRKNCCSHTKMIILSLEQWFSINKKKTIRFPLSTLFTLCILYVEEVSNSICLLLHANKQ